jgi:catechol 2,3-dioxygenase-like lactoylglutathione lyase family enzyme
MSSLIPELLCTSIAASRKFYNEILGFEILYERPEEGFVMFARQGVQIMFQELGAAREWITAPLERPFGRGVNFQIQTTAVDDLYAAVQRADATIFLPMEEKWYRADSAELGNRQFIVQDPDGYLLRFFQDLGKRKLA